MPQLPGLLGDRLDHLGVAMPERGDGDAAGEVEKLAPVSGVQIAAFAPLNGDVPPTIGRHYGCNHGNSPVRWIDGWDRRSSAIVVVARPKGLTPRARSIAFGEMAGRDRQDRASSPRSSPERPCG